MIDQEKHSRIGLCHGCFDLVHYGHLMHFQESKMNCDYLVVSITADTFVNKESGRPIYTQHERKSLIEALKPVDKVIISNYETAIESIKKISPSIFFKGPDYEGSKDVRFLLEKKCCEEISCRVYFTKSQKYSTTEFIRKCQKIKLN